MQTKACRVGIRSQGHSVLDFICNLGAQVVEQVLSHSGKLMNEGYAKLLKLVFGANSRQHQQVGRFDSPGAQHNPLRFNIENLAAAFHLDTDGLQVLEQYLPDENPSPHRQVKMVAHGIQVSNSGAHSPTVQVVRGPHPNARGVRAIGIFHCPVTRCQTGGVEGLLDI